jgi:nucleoside 2-deoxyribosyltransferase
MEDSWERATWLSTMRKRFYLSTRKDRSAQAAALLEALEIQGWERTYTWTDDYISPDDYADIAKAELAGVRQADVLVVLLPGGYGTHVEIGAALALGKPVILHAPNRHILEMPYPCVFHHHPEVELIVAEVIDVEALVALMSSRIENPSA